MSVSIRARNAYRWMKATKTGDRSWHTMDAHAVDEMIQRDFDRDDRAEIYAQCRQWIPALYTEDGEVVDLPLAAHARMGKSGTVGTISRRAPCRRCGGQGGWVGWRLEGGRCFRCHGRNSQIFEVVKTKVWTKAGLERLQASRAKAEAKRQEKAAKAARERQERIQALVAAHPDLQDLLDMEPTPGSFLASLQTQLRNKGSLSERQIEAATQALERQRERREAAAQSEYLGTPGERLQGLQATVVFVKDLEGNYGPKRLVKLLVRGRDLAVTFSTSAWVWDVQAGDQVVITGTVKEHSVYQDAKQTILTRTKMED